VVNQTKKYREGKYTYKIYILYSKNIIGYLSNCI
jgi:hypothetical protein